MRRVDTVFWLAASVLLRHGAIPITDTMAGLCGDRPPGLGVSEISECEPCAGIKPQHAMRMQTIRANAEKSCIVGFDVDFDMNIRPPFPVSMRCAVTLSSSAYSASCHDCRDRDKPQRYMWSEVAGRTRGYTTWAGVYDIRRPGTLISRGLANHIWRSVRSRIRSRRDLDCPWSCPRRRTD